MRVGIFAMLLAATAAQAEDFNPKGATSSSVTLLPTGPQRDMAMVSGDDDVMVDWSLVQSCASDPKCNHRAMAVLLLAVRDGKTHGP